MTFDFLGWKRCADCCNNDDDVDNGNNYNDFISAVPKKVKWLLIRKQNYLTNTIRSSTTIIILHHILFSFI